MSPLQHSHTSSNTHPITPQLLQSFLRATSLFTLHPALGSVPTETWMWLGASPLTQGLIDLGYASSGQKV